MAANDEQVPTTRSHGAGTSRWHLGRSHLVLLLAALVGLVTGLLVAGFDAGTRDGLFHTVLRAPLWVAALFPTVGLAIAVVTTRRLAHGDGATTDAFVRAYHERNGALPLRKMWWKLVACSATLGLGGGMGYEGPALLIGGSVGSDADRRFLRRFQQDDAKVLMVAGAAAGVAAVFKAPLTGVVFALEVPYTQDLARRALLPALVAAGTSYLVFVSLLGTEPVLPVGGVAPFDLRDLAGGLVLGLLCGVLARLGAQAITVAKKLTLPIAVRIAGGGGALAALAVATHHWYGAPISLGSGYDAIVWGRTHPEGIVLLAALFAARFAATWCTVAGGGVGGLFVPLVTQGALAGMTAQAVLHGANPGLFPVVGIAAFLGAGYRTPLAGVAFVAEATGEPGFIVPALLAAAAAQLAMGRWSFSPYQRDQRRPNLVPLDQLRLEEIMSPNPDTVAPETRVDECVRRMMRDNRRWVPVTESADGSYVGLLALSDVAHVAADRWGEVTAGEVARLDVPTAKVTDPVASVARLLRDLDTAAVAVVDEGTVVGVVTQRDIRNVERLLDRLDPEAAADDGTR